MKKNEILNAQVLENSQGLTLEEYCVAIRTDKGFVLELIEYHLIQPKGKTPEQWRFDSLSLRKGRIAASFYRELEVNMPGVALALDLLDKMEEFKKQLKILQNNYYD